MNAAANCDEVDACAPRIVPDDEIDQLPPRASAVDPDFSCGAALTGAAGTRRLLDSAAV